MNSWEQEYEMTSVIAEDQNAVFSEIKVKRRKEQPASKGDKGKKKSQEKGNKKGRTEVWNEGVDFSKQVKFLKKSMYQEAFKNEDTEIALRFCDQEITGNFEQAISLQ